MTFQRRGREHLRYIKKMAEQEWCESDFKIPFHTCLRHAMDKHIDYILQLERAMVDFARPIPTFRPKIKDLARPTSALNE